MRANNRKYQTMDLRRKQVHNEYGVLKTPFYSPRETPTRLIKRKPDKKVQKILNNGDKKKPKKNGDTDQFCYISQQSLKQISIRDGRSLSNNQSRIKQKEEKEEKVTQFRKRITSSPPRRENSKQIQSQNNISTHNRFRRMTAEQNEKINIERLQSDLQQTRAMNRILAQQLKTSNNQKQSQQRINKSLNQKFDLLNQALKEVKKQNKQYEKEIMILNKALKNRQQQLNAFREQLQENKNKSLSINKKKQSEQELQKMLSEINKGFDDIFVDSKMILSNFQEGIPQSHCHVLPLEKQPIKQSQQLIIYNMQQKIKYMQMQIGMLKRYKFEYQRVQKQYEKYKSQMKMFNKKIVRQQQQRQQQRQRQRQRQKNRQKFKEITKDDSISFDLSKDETTDDI